MAGKGRRLNEEEAAFLSVYKDAERSLLDSVTEETRAVVDSPADQAAARHAEGVRNVTGRAESTARGLERGSAARLDRVLAAAADEGSDAAIGDLGRITGGGRTQYADRFNRGAVDRLAVSTADRMTGAHRSILRTTPDAFREVTSRVMAGNLIGTQTGREVAQRAVWALQDRGMTGFIDRAGRRWSLTAYAEMATRTASARAKVEAQLDRLRGAGHELVIVGHTGQSCDYCAPWENQVLTIDGPDGAGVIRVEHAIEDGVYVDVRVGGSVEEARRAGFMHPNCGHSLSLYQAGLTEPARPDSGRDLDDEHELYEASQRQREIERAIRKWKGREAGAFDPGSASIARRQVRAWQTKMREHLDANPRLMRYRDREGIGAGFNPTTSLRRRVGPDGPTPNVVEAGRARTPRQMTDVELDRRMAQAIRADDMDLLDRLDGEVMAREQRRASAAERRQARREAEDERRGQEFDRLLAQGVDEETAVSDAYGVSVDRQRRDRARSQLSASGYHGTFEQQARASYRDRVRADYLAAEDSTRGHMLSRDAERRGVDPHSLFSGPETRARANASDELLAWWDENGRITYDEWRAELLDDGGAARRLRGGRGDFLT